MDKYKEIKIYVLEQLVSCYKMELAYSKIVRDDKHSEIKDILNINRGSMQALDNVIKRMEMIEKCQKKK